MATATKTFARVLRSSPAKTSSLRAASTPRISRMSRPRFQQPARRGYASSNSGAASGNNAYIYSSVLAALVGSAGVYSLNTRPTLAENPPQEQVSKRTKPEEQTNAISPPKEEDYQTVYNAIAARLIDQSDYDDGSYGPIVLRLAWHASGTYDAATGTGGSNGATMRFAAESNHGANKGLNNARDFLEPIKEQFPWISYSDLWTLAGVCAVQEMSGPDIPWRPGRQDRNESFCTPDGRIPAGSGDQHHLRAIFYRMGFDDREIVALSGAHALGRCHSDRSGFEGPWTFSPITLTNDFYRLLLDEGWHERDWKGARQFQDDATKTLMMLPTDMVLVTDEAFKPHVERYAADQDVFFDEFSGVVMKLFELGVPFESREDARIVFKRTE